ncbi:MAG: translation initiation factor IF-2 subunit gamma [Nanoarchaeota archaeon]|nr:translation initiation factor IF-2 subunit gamma [Nanoarchaeota archaeon]MBU2459314.1 translation initiation factor IF-2 subunit gamma [Nanoarchaeota archaeon]
MDKGLPEINIGVVGHIDHGKTTLLSRLSGKFTDTHSEELKRGITIKLGYAETTIFQHPSGFSNKETENEKRGTPVRYVSFIDAPGHEMLMATMLSGAAIIDAAILVVAANEGIKPQTREHLMALQAKNIKDIIVVQNKIDLTSKEQAMENYKEIKEFLKGTIMENAPIIPVSAQQEINIDKIFEEIMKIKIPERDLKSEPLFFVARSFDINRPGSEIEKLHGGILGGILKKGVLKIGDEIEIKPGINIKKSHGEMEYKTLTTKILSLYRGKEAVNEVSPGASISIETALDPSITKADFLRGCIVSSIGSLPEISHSLKMKATLFKEVSGLNKEKIVEPLKTKELLMLSINTTITVGTIEKISGDEVEVILNIPVVILKEDKVGIARNIEGHWRLIGWGDVV